MVRLIARVDGFLGRKGDGGPGVKTIWRGIQDVRVAVLTSKRLKAGWNAGYLAKVLGLKI